MPELSCEKRDRVAWLRLDLPDHRLSPEGTRQLTALADGLAEDDAIEVVVLTGAGAGFCTGLADTSTLTGTRRAQEIRARFDRLDCVEAIAALSKPTLAAVNGDALGVGLELALACDIRLVRSDARLGMPQVLDGLIPFCGGTQRLPRVVGQAKALELILTGRLIDAAEAYRIGLVTETIARSELGTRVDEVVAGLLGKGPIALRLAKEAVRQAMDLTLDQGIRLEEDLYVLLQTTDDRAEGVRAFLAKRKPRFAGR